MRIILPGKFALYITRQKEPCFYYTAWKTTITNITLLQCYKLITIFECCGIYGKNEIEKDKFTLKKTLFLKIGQLRKLDNVITFSVWFVNVLAIKFVLP